MGTYIKKSNDWLHDSGAAFVFLKLLTLEKYGGVTSIGTLKSSCASKILKRKCKS